MQIIHTPYGVVNDDLKPYLTNYLDVTFTSDTDTKYIHQVPPLGFPVLMFYYGEKTNFYNHNHLTNQSILIGQLTKHVKLHPINGTKLFGVNFKPYGLYNLLGISPNTIRNSATECTPFFGYEPIKNIIKALQKGKNIDEIISIIEALLISKKCEKKNRTPHFDAIVDKIIEMNGVVDPFDLLNKSVSTRTFQRYFSEVIGIAPKLFCQVLRHRFILETLYAKPETKWHEIIKDFYYDYSHFKKDFVNFTTIKPFEFMTIKNNFTSSLLEKQNS